MGHAEWLLTARGFHLRKLKIVYKHACTLPEINLYQSLIGVNRTPTPSFSARFISQVFVVHLAS